MKYMEINNGVVEVHLYNEGDDVHIDISDNGKGISQKDIGHIFDRFTEAILQEIQEQAEAE